MSIDWGTVPSWVAGVGAAVALVFARSAARAAQKASQLQGVQIAQLQEESRQRVAREHRSLAVQVAVWATTEVVGDGSRKAVVKYVNSGGLPIYMVKVYCFTPNGEVEHDYYAVGPQSERTTMLLLTDEVRRTLGDLSPGDLVGSGRLAVSCRFRDAAGAWWCRTTDGELHPAPDAEAAALLASRPPQRVAGDGGSAA